jgi:hypothetical protein
MSEDFTLKAEDLDILTEHDETLLFTMFAMLRRWVTWSPEMCTAHYEKRATKSPPIKICPTRRKTQGT